MRRMILAAMLTAMFATMLNTGALHAGKKLDVGAGRIAWFDITTTNMAQSKEFYGKLFDWHFTSVKGGGDFAAEIVSGDLPIGTLRVAEGKISGYNGVAYVQVNDMLASCKKARDLGGVIPPGFPFNLPDGIGAIALVVDPSGHPVGMYSRTPLPPKPTASK